MQFSNHQVTVFSTVVFVDATRALTVCADVRVRWLRTLLNFPAWNLSAWQYIILKYYNCHCFNMHATMQTSGDCSELQWPQLAPRLLIAVLFICMVAMHNKGYQTLEQDI